MTRRIVSGVFLLIALGVLGVIIAGALTSGEQLVVRFLTAIIVAALALYVISDLRLQATDEAAAAATARATVPAPRITTGEEHPPNSTAAFMATVTNKKSKTGDSSADAARDNSPREASPALAIGSAVVEQEVALHTAATATPAMAEADPVEVEAVADFGASTSLRHADIDPDATMEAPASPYDDDSDDADLWPFNDADVEPSESDLAELDDVEGLVAMFAKQTEQQVSETKTLTLAGHTVGSSRGGDGPTADFDTAFGAGGNDDDEDGEMTDVVEATNTDEASTELPTNGGDEIAQREKSTEGVEATTNGGASAIDAPASSTEETTGAAALARLTAELPTLPAADGAGTYASSGIAPIIDLRPATPAADTGLESAIRSGEYGVIASLIEQGMLSTDGPITDRDVRTMVYVAFTSSELRKILSAGGTIDGDNSGLELGGVDVFTPPLAVGSGSVDDVPAIDAPIADDDTPDFPQSQAL